MNRLHKIQMGLTRVQALETEVDDLGGYYFMNDKSSYEFGKKLAKKLQVLANLKEEENYEDVADRLSEDAVDDRPVETTKVGLQLTFDEAWRCKKKWQ
ncbi:hypothetical protein AB3S75_001139 [Citrus x aurantiifolia]